MGRPLGKKGAGLPLIGNMEKPNNTIMDHEIALVLSEGQ
jgi:hypothetical protein